MKSNHLNTVPLSLSIIIIIMISFILIIYFYQSKNIKNNKKEKFRNHLNVNQSSLKFDIPLKDRTFGVIGGVLLTEETGVVSLLVSELGGDNKCCGVSIIILDDCDL